MATVRRAALTASDRRRLLASNAVDVRRVSYRPGNYLLAATMLAAIAAIAYHLGGLPL